MIEADNTFSSFVLSKFCDTGLLLGTDGISDNRITRVMLYAAGQIERKLGRDS